MAGPTAASSAGSRRTRTPSSGALGDRIATWTVLNEPEVFVTHGHEDGVHAPGFRDPALTLRTSHVVNLAHAEGVRAVRAAAPRRVGRVRVQHGHRVPGVGRPARPRGGGAAPRLGQRLVPRPARPRALPGRVPRPGRGARRDGHPAGRHGVDGDDLRLHRAEHVLAGDHRRRSRPTRGSGVRRVEGPGRRNSFGWEIWPAALHRLVRRVDHDYGHPGDLHHGERVRRRDRPGRRRAGPRREPGRLPGGPPRPARPRDRRRLRRARLLRVVPARQLRVGRRLHAAVRHRLGRLRRGGGRRIVKDSGWWLRDLVAAGSIEYDDALA